MMINGHNHTDFSQKMQRCQDYVHALEEERRKIQVFERELPLCLELVTQAIEACKQQLSVTVTECNLRGQSECNISEQTSSDDVVPVLEEFIPIKRASSESVGEEQDSKKPKNNNSRINKDVNKNEQNSKKSDWLRSAQLWNQTPDPPSKEESHRKVDVVEVKRDGDSSGAFQPFKKEKSVGSRGALAVVPPASTSSTAESGGGNKKEEQSEIRKARRCWSAELHKRFLQALQQLGGSHVATPKQIRELMKVDGLTNDEVKSHLQKYRLHTRRPNPSSHNNNNNVTQTPQFVVVGGIWVPSEYTSIATTTTTSGEKPGVATTSKGIYTPIAALPPPFGAASPKQRQQKSNSDEKRGCSHSEGANSSNSTHTTTISPAY